MGHKLIQAFHELTTCHHTTLGSKTVVKIIL